MNKDMKLIVTVPGQFTGALFTQGIAAVLDKCTVEVMEKPTMGCEQPRSLVESGGVLLPQRTDEAKRDKVKRRFIKFRCEDCGEFVFGMCEQDEEGNYHIACRHCAQKYKFADDILEYVEYTCLSCGQANYFFMPEVENLALSYDMCRNCRAETPLQYVQSLRKYTAK